MDEQDFFLISLIFVLFIWEYHFLTISIQLSISEKDRLRNYIRNNFKKGYFCVKSMLRIFGVILAYFVIYLSPTLLA